MKTQLNSSISIKASIAALVMVSFAALAQEAAMPRKADFGAFSEIKIKPRGMEINVPCCQCGKEKSTVIDLSTGVAPWTSPQGVLSAIGAYPGWKVPTAPTRWVYTGSNNAGNYTYNLKINVPKNCNIAPTVSFAGTGWGDNNITVRLDDKILGTTAVSSGGQANYGFRDPYGVSVNGSIGTGSHTLSVTVRNDDSMTGFLFDGKLKIDCPSSENPYNSGQAPMY